MIRFSSGQLNLDPNIPQNSFQRIAEKLIGDSCNIIETGVVTDNCGSRARELTGAFCLADNVLGHARECVKCISYAYIALSSEKADRTAGYEPVGNSVEGIIQT
jgi:hypothetical protein